MLKLIGLCAVIYLLFVLGVAQAGFHLIGTICFYFAGIAI
jgi:hypothetical protein